MLMPLKRFKARWLGSLLSSLLVSVSANAAQDPGEMLPVASQGYWVGVELIGDSKHFSHAVELLKSDRILSNDPPAAPVLPKNAHTIGHVGELQHFFTWLSHWAFFGIPLPSPTIAQHRLWELPAPLPSGLTGIQLDVYTHAFVIGGVHEDGSFRSLSWPQDLRSFLPPHLQNWTSATLFAQQAPLYATPAAQIPPASERSTIVSERGDIYVLGTVDRCQREAQKPLICLRWLQVLVRNGHVFFTGYLPAFQVALDSAWQRGQGSLPRAQLIFSGVDETNAQFVLLAQARDRSFHRRTIPLPFNDSQLPLPSLRIDGDLARITYEGKTIETLALDATMDLRETE